MKFNVMAKSSLFKPLQCLEPSSWKFGVETPLFLLLNFILFFVAKIWPFSNFHHDAQNLDRY